MQSRYYDPTTCRFINADSYASTGQGFLGHNMFAYCNNGPVSHADPSGHALVVCLKDDHDPTLGMFVGLTGGGGGSVAYAASIRPESVREFAKKVGTAIRTGAEASWDAYMRSYNIQQEAQLMESQAILDGAVIVYDYLVETEALDMGRNTLSTVQATISFKKSLTYFLAPIPTPVDEALGIGYALKGFYQLATIIVREIE